jgi:hypothetical protein
MTELSVFERRLATGLEVLAGAPRNVDAVAIAQTAASRAPVRSSVLSRLSAMTGPRNRVRGSSLGDLGMGRTTRPLMVVIAVVLITALVFGALAVGSGLVRLTSVPRPSQMPPPSQTPAPSVTPAPTIAQPRPAVWASAGDVPFLLGPTPFAVTLHDGRVLLVSAICGGCGGAAHAAALYDPTTRSWSAASSPVSGIGSATLLLDGMVLGAGGESGIAAQLYDPGTGRWIATGSMTVARPFGDSGFTATVLQGGKVLVAGGSTGAFPAKALTNAELYDPSTGQWVATGSMLHARANHSATLLPDGRVLVAGGWNRRDASGLATILDSAETYDPQTGTWTRTQSMPQPRAWPTATLLPDGLVLVAGGGLDLFKASVVSAALYDPRTGTWTSAGNMSIARNRCTATLLLDGSVLIAGGYLAETGRLGSPHSTATAERYDPKTGSWTLTAGMSGPRARHTAVLLADGRVLVAGGEGSPGLDYYSSELYDPGIKN